jgi:hypothetical protein
MATQSTAGAIRAPRLSNKDEVFPDTKAEGSTRNGLRSRGVKKFNSEVVSIRIRQTQDSVDSLSSLSLGTGSVIDRRRVVKKQVHPAKKLAKELLVEQHTEKAGHDKVDMANGPELQFCGSKYE